MNWDHWDKLKWAKQKTYVRVNNTNKMNIEMKMMKTKVRKLAASVSRLVGWLVGWLVGRLVIVADEVSVQKWK